MNSLMIVDGVTQHEGFSAWVMMHIRLLLGSLLFNLIIYLVICCLYISHLDKEFKKVGLTKGAFRQYLVNRYIYG
jgi:hypothetical protein